MILDIKTLIVDQDQNHLKELVEAIESTTQAQVRASNNGPEALSTIINWKPDIVILDTELKHISGIHIVEEINSFLDLINTSVILMAGEIDNDLRIKAFTNGVHDFFEKPVNKLEALQKIHNLISIKKASAKLTELNAKLEREKSILIKYFPKDLVTKILNEEITPNLGGETLNASILFFDLQGSTTIAESIAPDLFSNLLSELFTGIMNIAFDNGGSVNKLIGDGMLITFGCPVPKENDVLNCIRCAVKIREHMAIFNESLPSYINEPLRFGIGIGTGKIFAGNIGSHTHMEYTVLGDPVNVAAKLESLSKLSDFDILIDGKTHELLEQDIKVKKMKFDQIEGKIQKVNTYALIELLAE